MEEPGTQDEELTGDMKDLAAKFDGQAGLCVMRIKWLGECSPWWICAGESGARFGSCHGRK